MITVGVIAERDDGPVVAQEAGTAPPTVAAPVPAPKVTPGGSGTQRTVKKPASAPSSTRAKQAITKQGKTQATSRAKTQRASAKGTAKAKTAGQAGRSKATPPPAREHRAEAVRVGAGERRSRLSLRAVPRKTSRCSTCGRRRRRTSSRPVAARRPHRDPHKGRLPLVRVASASERPSRRCGRAGAPQRSVANRLTRAGDTGLESKSVRADGPLDGANRHDPSRGRPTDHPGARARRSGACSACPAPDPPEASWPSPTASGPPAAVRRRQRRRLVAASGNVIASRISVARALGAWLRLR